MIKKLYLLPLVALFTLFTSTYTFASETTTKHHTKVERTKKADESQSVNINTADTKELMTLKYVGSKRAEAIISYREKNGAFNAIDDLKKVKGITAKIIEANKDRIRFS
jgi:competence protein ComEA